MKTTSNIKKGIYINYNNDIYKIIDFLHVKPGKGSAFVRTKLKSLTNKKIINNTFSAGHKISIINIETRKYQFLYKDNYGYHFMNHYDFSQICIDKKLVSCYQWMKSGENIDIIFKKDDDMPISVEMPTSVVLEIIETEKTIKGNSITNNTKIAKVETGAKVLVPLFIKKGEKIKINTESGNYIERIKNLNFNKN